MSSAGSAREVEELLAQVRRQIEGYVARRHPEWAAEIAQESLLVIHLKYSHLRELADLTRVGIKIASFKIFEYSRREQRKNEIPMVEEVDISDANSASPEERLIQDAAARQLLQNISRLRAGCREILRLLLAGKSNAEIMQTLQIPTSGVYHTRLSRCRRQLRELMGWSL